MILYTALFLHNFQAMEENFFRKQKIIDSIKMCYETTFLLALIYIAPRLWLHQIYWQKKFSQSQV